MLVFTVTAELQYCSKIEAVPECVNKENNVRRHGTCMLGSGKLEKHIKVADIMLRNGTGD